VLPSSAFSFSRFPNRSRAQIVRVDRHRGRAAPLLIFASSSNSLDETELCAKGSAFLVWLFLRLKDLRRNEFPWGYQVTLNCLTEADLHFALKSRHLDSEVLQSKLYEKEDRTLPVNGK
jgi:hypothetical protein